MTDETIRSTNVRGLKTHEEIFETFDKSVFSPARKAPLSARRTFYYDARNRVIQSVETTPLGYGLRISYKYDYSGNILIRDEQHNISEGEPLNLRYAYTYDGRGRQLREVVSINGKVCADVASAYDELGRLQTKTAGNGLETEHKHPGLALGNHAQNQSPIGKPANRGYALDSQYYLHRTTQLFQTAGRQTPVFGKYRGNILEPGR